MVEQPEAGLRRLGGGQDPVQDVRLNRVDPIVPFPVDERQEDQLAVVAGVGGDPVGAEKPGSELEADPGIGDEAGVDGGSFPAGLGADRRRTS